MIKIDSLTKNYSSKNNTIVALDNINISFPDKGFFAVCGKSGSGKTTLLKILSGIEKPSFGDVYVDNLLINDFSNEEMSNYQREYIGFIFQEYNLIEKFSVYQNVKIALNNLSEEEKIDEYLSKVGIKNFKNRLVSELSGGEKQRVAIARILAKNTKIVLADEPTSSLDKVNSRIIFEILKKLSENQLVIISTHNEELANIYCDKIINISNGKIENHESLCKREILGNTFREEKLKKANSKMNFYITFLFLKHYLVKNVFFGLLLLLFLLSILSLMTIVSLSPRKIKYKNYNKSNFNEIFIRKTLYSNIELTNFSEIDYINLNNDDVIKIKKQLNSDKVYPIYRNISELDENLDLLDYTLISEEDNKVFNVKINGSMELTESLIKDFDFKLLSGKIPEISQEKTEIVVTKVIFEVLKKYGKRLYIKYDDLIGETINLNINGIKTNCEIVGIIDTNFYPKRYKNIFSRHIISSIDDEVNEYFSRGLHTSIFFPATYFSNFEENKHVFSNVTINMSNISTSILYDEIPKNLNIIYNKGKEKIKKLDSNQIIFPINKKNPEIESTYLEFVREHSEKSFLSIKDFFEKKFGSGKSFQDYYNYILANDDNIFIPLKNKKYFYEKAVLKISTRKISNRHIRIFTSSHRPIDFNKEFEFVGVYLYENEKDYKIYSSKKLIDNLKNIISDFGYPIKSLVVPNDKNIAKKVFSIVDYVIEDVNVIPNNYLTFDKKITYTTNSYITKNVDYYFKEIDRSMWIFWLTLFVLIVFLVLLILYHIISIFSLRKKDISVLLSLGINRKNINFMFLLENIVIFTFAFILSIIFLFILIKVISKIIVKKYLLLINPLVFDFNNILILFSIIVLFLYLISLFYMLKIKRTKINLLID